MGRASRSRPSCHSFTVSVFEHCGKLEPNENSSLRARNNFNSLELQFGGPDDLSLSLSIHGFQVRSSGQVDPYIDSQYFSLMGAAFS